MNLGNGNGVNSEGDVVPIDDVTPGLLFESVEGDADVDDEEVYKASRRLVGDNIASVAVHATVSPEQLHQYPETAEQVIARRAQSKSTELEHYDAYTELGGGVPGREGALNRPLENVLDNEYEPWQKDIRLAVEQFGLAEFSLDMFRAMKPADLALFSTYFYAYLENIDTNIRLINESDGDVDVNTTLHARYGRPSQDALKKYGRTLGWLKSDLEETGVPQVVRTQLNIPKVATDGGRQRRELLQKVQHDKRIHHGRDVRVVLVKGRLSVERSPARH